ncbi:MAG: hypothetical protein ACOCUR_02175, partial [Nanoarchaeota archaeon]
MIKKVFLLFAIAAIILSFGSSGSDDCPDGEFRIRMNDFFIVEPGENNSRTMTRYLSNSACCPSRYDCVYRSNCYPLGSIIDINPRYACGPSNNLI